jgi:hypothetical protein
VCVLVLEIDLAPVLMGRIFIKDVPTIVAMVIQSRGGKKSRIFVC